MKRELRDRIIAYNRTVAQRKEKAGDLDVLITELVKLPKGQLKKVLTAPVVAVLEKYGYTAEEV
jgi:hypothetical protein